MGELSKKIGEYGEKKVMEFLSLLGWQPIETGVTIECFNPSLHKRSEKRGTHGKDLGFTYHSPLSEGELIDVFVSVKYSKNPYEENPRSKFHSHFSDLANGISCYKKSSERVERINHFFKYSKVRTIGVLFWLNNSPKDSDKNLLSDLAISRFHEDLDFEEIIVVTNEAYTFIKTSIREIKARTSSEKIEFYYPATGKNLNPTTRKISGKILPIEFLTSNILPFRVKVSENEWHLYLFSKQPFSVSDFKRLVGLSIDISNGLAKKIIIGFSDYNELLDENSINVVLQSFEEKEFALENIFCINIDE
ncbi:hypothetical protein [Zunongwangia sp. H14]|uniref:GapS4a family protein n=1 Tax=Zunongwangia sp. H14 TaxID=3240792 RepID=UPI0035695A8D